MGICRPCSPLNISEPRKNLDRQLRDALIHRHPTCTAKASLMKKRCPDSKDRALNSSRDLNEPRAGTRMISVGLFADLIGSRTSRRIVDHVSVSRFPDRGMRNTALRYRGSRLGDSRCTQGTLRLTICELILKFDSVCCKRHDHPLPRWTGILSSRYASVRSLIYTISI